MTKIRVVACPSGEAPQHVREAWIGLELPTARRRFVFTAGVLTGPRKWWQRFLALKLGLFRIELGYQVDALAAVTILASKDPNAAFWWRTHCGDLLDGKHTLVFAARVCQECT